MSYNLYLFANNNGGQAENNGSYRLYDMKIDGEGVKEEGKINYADYILYNKGGNAFITDISYQAGLTAKFKFREDLSKLNATGMSTMICQLCITNKQPSGGNNDYKANGSFIMGNLAQENGKTTEIPCENGVYSYTFTENLTDRTRYIAFGGGSKAWGGNPLAVEYFKIYRGEYLLLHLRPCFDTNGIPCMYDEVSKKYIYPDSALSPDFKITKALRDFQPVLDSNNIPCLLDKINNKFYYNNSGEVFKTIEKPKYKKLKSIIGDKYNYINIENQTIDQDSIVEVGWEIVDTSQSQQCFILKGLYTLQRGSNDICYLYNSPVRKEIFYSTCSNGNKHDIKITKDKLTLDSNEVDLVSKGFPQTYSITGDLKLFYYSEMGMVFGEKSKISYFKLYHSEQLVLDLIPVLDQNNIPCMYDKVSDQFFYNQGTGTFGYEIEELEGECYEIACTTEDIVNNINPLLVNVKFEVLDNKTISMPKSGGWTTMQFDGKSNKGLKLKANTKYTIIVKPISAYTFNKNTACNVCVTDKQKYILNLDKPTIAETGDKGEFLLYPHISDSPVEQIGIIVLEGEYPDAVYSSFDNIQVSTHAEYIESNGTQYIDTGVVPNSNTDIDMTCRACDYNESPTVNNSYILNGLVINDNKYNYKGTDTTVQPNLVASEGATLTMGSTNLAYLTDDEKEQAINNGWSLL